MKFFNMDSPLMRFMTKVANLMIVNVAFLLTCLPVVTVGAATTALYYVTLKMIRDEESGILRSFFMAFRANFRQATALWLGQLALMVLLLVDLRILAQIDSPIAAAMNTGIFLILAAVLLICLYAYALVAQYENTLLVTLKNACLMALGSLPQTLLMGAFCTGCAVITFYNGYTASYAVPVWMFLGFGLVAFGNSAILNKVFSKYIPDASRDTNA